MNTVVPTPYEIAELAVQKVDSDSSSAQIFETVLSVYEDAMKSIDPQNYGPLPLTVTYAADQLELEDDTRGLWEFSEKRSEILAKVQEFFQNNGINQDGKITA